MMHEREVSGTGLRLTEIGFGGAPLGNLYSVTSEGDAAASVAEAWECGIRYFDTAPHYGLGLSESRLGKALSEYTRSDLVISTKVGRLIVPNEAPTEFDTEGYAVPGDFRREWDFSRDGILRSVEASLRRLRTDYIDILYLHDPEVSGVTDAITTGTAALVELRDQGVVRAVGIGSNSAVAVARAFRESDIDLAMLAGRYTLLEQRGADAVFEAAGQRPIVAAGVFNSGLLSTARPGTGAMYNYAPAPPALIARASELADIAEAHGSTLPHVAIAFPLRNRQVASVVLGMRTAEQVRENVKFFQSEPANTVWPAITERG